MSLKGDASRYGALAAGLHWVSAVPIVLMVPIGFAAARTSDPASAAALLRVHLPLGLLALLLTLIRVIWWVLDSRPDASANQPLWQRRAALAVHAGLCLLVLALCATGIATIALSHAAPLIFSVAPAELPRFADHASMPVHLALAVLLVAVLGLHLGAVVYHLLRGDRPFARMRLTAWGGRP